MDDYLEVVRARCRRNTLLATAYDLKVFFTVVGKDPVEVTVADVLGFIRTQRGAGGEARWSASLIGTAGWRCRRSGAVCRRCRASTATWSRWGWWRSTRCCGGCTARRRRSGAAGGPLVRQVRRLPQVLTPEEVNALLGGLRRWRDRAMIEAMLLGGLRRSEVLGLRLEDLRFGASGGCSSSTARAVINGGCRSRPGSSRSVTEYLHRERPADAATDRVFVVLKGPHRGQPLTAKGLEQIIARRPGAGRAGPGHLP